MAEPKPRKSFTKEYKPDVIAQSYQRENIAELASELGLRPKRIYRWRAEYKDNPEASFPGQGRLLDARPKKNWSASGASWPICVCSGRS